MKDIAFLPASELAVMISTRQIGSRELLEHYLKRLDAFNPQINAVIVTDLSRARQEADAADTKTLSGSSLGPLHGVPMTVKESFNLAGLPTTYGLPAFKDNVARRDAAAVASLKRAGAVIFGKTNVPPWLADSQSDNAVYGRTNNPWDTARSPGGSSGGSAAALAAGLTALELGSDIASSVRNPAHYCGVFGHKPTYGLCSMAGHSLGESFSRTDISVIGPLARSAGDLGLCLSLIAGPDPIDSRAWKLALPAAAKTRIDAFRVAVVVDDPIAEVDEGVRAEIRRLSAFLREAGAVVSETARPAFAAEELDAVYMTMVRAATSGRLADPDMAMAMERLQTGPAAGQKISAYTIRGNTMSHREWLVLNEQRHRFRMAWDAFFGDWDLLLCPVASTAAFPHDSREIPVRTLSVNGRDVAYADHLFWAGYSGLAYLPASVAPIGLTPEGLPVGVQIVGPQYGDLTTIAFAGMLETAYRSFSPPPGFE